MTSAYVSHTILRRAVTEPGNASRASWLLRRLTYPQRASRPSNGGAPVASTRGKLAPPRP